MIKKSEKQMKIEKRLKSIENAVPSGYLVVEHETGELLLVKELREPPKEEVP